jgi:ABC-2 type transport system ATP-binding protein
MSASSQIDVEAEMVRRSIAQDLKAGSSALSEFSRRYARTPKDKNKALAIKVSIPAIADPAIAEDLRSRMTDILDGILADCARGDANMAITLPDGTKMENPNVARNRMFARFRKEPLKQESICRVDKLEKRFDRSGFVVGPVSFEFRAGEITALFGENAHGKTTLLRTVVGEYRASSGSVTFPALSPSLGFHWSDVRQYIGYLPQKLPDWRGSLKDTLYFWAALRGLSPPESETQVKYLVARLDLADHIAKRWSELSGGFQLRFALAQVLVGRPRLLVLDEPLANLDPKAQAALLWDIRTLATSVHSPMAVLISSQVLNPLETISDNLIFLRNGRVKYGGPTGGIGSERKSNLYECDTSVGLSVLFERIGKHVQEIKHNGVYYIIKTPLTVSYSDMLQLLKDADVAFTHCRDIGRKAVGLFEWN